MVCRPPKCNNHASKQWARLIYSGQRNFYEDRRADRLNSILTEFSSEDYSARIFLEECTEKESWVSLISLEMFKSKLLRSLSRFRELMRARWIYIYIYSAELSRTICGRLLCDHYCRMKNRRKTRASFRVRSQWRNKPQINYGVEVKDRKYVPEGDIGSVGDFHISDCNWQPVN